MRNKFHFVMLMTAVIMALVASAIGPYAVYADDGGTTEPAGDTAPISDSTEEPAEVTEGESSEPMGETIVEEPVAAETESVEATEGETSSPVSETVTEEPVSVPEILEQAPEGTGLIVVNEAGEVVPLATVEAEEIITTSDPMWCPEGATPGDTGCTGSFSSFNDLIDALTTDAASATPVFTGNGFIWVEDSYNGNDNDQILFDGSILTNLGTSNLTIQGGWSGGNNTNITGISNLDVSLVFVNWGGNITINDLAITAGDGSGFGLLVNNAGNVSMDNVSVTGTTANSFGFGDGALVASSGDVDIVESEFDNNQGNGLQVLSGGQISLDTVSASGNSLTGAYLDTCIYNDVTGLCAGNGAVTVTSTTGNMFNNNGFTGLSIDSGGGVVMDHTQANNNALDGVLITGADDDGTGDVSIDESEFSGNANGYGLDVFTDGNLNVTNVTAHANGLGAFLDTTAGTGDVNVSASNFGDSASTGNTWTGLHIESGGAVTLLDLVASFNGTNGTYVEAEGDIYVANGTFNENVHFNFPQDPGLYAQSNGGNITLVDVVADGNDFGAGVVLKTKNDGEISVSATAPGNSHFNGNGTFGVQASTGNGDITLMEIETSYNESKGIYLNSYGEGNIFIANSLVVENGGYGIYAIANTGDVDVENVTVTGDDGVETTANDDLTNVGAVLKSHSGNVFVTASVFEMNKEAGLVIISSKVVTLDNVTADKNGGNGVEVYTPQTAACRPVNDTVMKVTVNVGGGTLTDNGDYGLLVMPGPAGTLNFVTPSVFGGNGLGDYLLDLSAPENCPVVVEEPSKPEKPNIITVPETGSNEPVEQDCDLFTSTIHQLPNGTFVNVGCPYKGFSNLNELLVGNLPAPLGAGVEFVAGLVLGLTDAEGNTILNQDGTVTITFAIPEGSRNRTHSVLFWDTELNDGQGGWMKLPPFEAGTSFPLHPENPDDSRVVISGVQQVNNTVTFTVNFSGTFVLTTP